MGVVEVVVVKVNGPVLLGSEIEVDVVRRPVVAVHCPGGPVRRVAVQPIFGHVGDQVGGEVSAEVPCPYEAVPDLRGRSAVPQRFELPQAQGAPEQRRPVDLAVEVAGDPGSGGVLPFAVARHYERHAIFGDFELPYLPFDHRGGLIHGPDGPGLLVERHPSGGRVVGRRHEVPRGRVQGRRAHGHPGGDSLHPTVCAPDTQGQATLAVQHHAVSGAAEIGPLGQDAL